MLKYLASAAILFLPGILAVFLDCKFAKNAKNLFSKYCFYSLLNNALLFAVMIIRCLSEYTVLTAFDIPKIAVTYGAVALVAAVVFPVIIRKRLPKAAVAVYEYIMSCEAAYIALVMLTGVTFFAIRLFFGKNIEVFSNLAMLGCVVLATVIPVLVICIFKVLKGAKNNGFKKTIAHISAEFKESDAVAFKRRLGVAALVDLAFVFSVILFIPYETYLGNAGEFVFSFSSFWWIIAVEALAYLAVLLVIQFVMSGRVFNVAVGLVFGVTLAAYVQSMFMNGAMSQMDGASESWPVATIAVNLVIWAVIVLVPAVIAAIGLKFWKTVCTLGCVLVLGMQSVALISLGLSFEKPKIETRITTDGIYEIAEDNNVIVFVLDCFDIDNVKGMLEAEPDVFEDMYGFTGYTNVTGSYSFTHLAVPYLITGERIPQYDPTDEQFANAAETSKYYNTIADNVSDFRIYTDEFCVKGEAARSKMDNLNISAKEVLKTDVVIRSSQKAAFYRALPFCFKTRFSYTSQDFNLALNSDYDGQYYLVSSLTDATMKSDIEKNGLSINSDYTDGCFRFIHTNGPHLPCYLDKDGNYSSEQTDAVSASLGSLKMVKAYIKALEELGCYEDATIIITSDHGATYTTLDTDEIDVSISPIMFYKPAGAGYGDAFRFSAAPVSHDDVFPTVMAAFGFEYSNEHGMNLGSVAEDAERTRYYYWHRQEPDMPKTLGNYMHVEYIVEGDANLDESWKETGNIVHCNGWEKVNGK